MKKAVFVIGILALGIVVFIKAQTAKVAISDIALANIEALANGESGGTTLKCYKTVSTNGSGQLTHVTYCGECKAVKANAWSNQWQCK